MTAAERPVGPAGSSPERGSGPRAAPASFHVLAKPTGARCNLDCRYCFFLAKADLYPDSRFRMPEAVLEAYLRQVIEAQTAPHVTIAWQGGEPTLMGLPFFRRAMELVHRYLRPGMTVEHTIQTNGTRLDEDWCRFLHEHRFLVGLSMDGPRASHDAYRVDKGGRPTFDRVLRAARRLQRHQVPFNILCSVHVANTEQPLEVYRFFRDRLQATFLQFIPIVERAGADSEQVTERSVSPEAWGRFLIAVFDEWVRHDVGRVYVQLFDAALAAWAGLPSPMCVFAETCGEALALEHNGDLYSCDHFVDPAHLLGNILKTPIIELVTSAPQRAFGAAKRDALPDVCRRCPVRFACHGECPRNRFRRAPDGAPGLNYLCAGYLGFFQHVDRPMRIMADLLACGRAPAAVMDLVDPVPAGAREPG